MTARKKNIRAFAKTNPDIPLYGELPPVIRKTIIRRKGMLSIHGDVEKIPMIITMFIVPIR